MSNLFHDDYLIDLTDDEWRVVRRDVIGDGGAQLLLRRLLAQCVRQRLRADDLMLDRAYLYAYGYGCGGFQDRFRAIIRAALRAGWTPAPDGKV